jgi:hypothetical protein
VRSSTSGKRAFAIIGTREPDSAQRQVAAQLSSIISCWHTVRTGGEYGIDFMVMQAAAPSLEVYLPWAAYNRQIIPRAARVIVYDPYVHKTWTESVQLYHPAPARLAPEVQAGHARRFGIVEGCAGVVALPGPGGSGSAAQGIRVARALKIPLVQGNRGHIKDADLFAERALEQLGLGELLL